MVDRSAEMALVYAVVGLMVGAGAIAAGYEIGRATVQTGGPSATPPANNTTQPVQVSVHMKDFKFNPAAVTVPVGSTVTWVNDDEVFHTVTSDETSGPLKSSNVNKGETYAYTFNAEGTFAYHCIPHSIHDMSGHGPMYSGMVGTVTVTSGAGGTSGADGGHKPRRSAGRPSMCPRPSTAPRRRTSTSTSRRAKWSPGSTPPPTPPTPTGRSTAPSRAR
jgi:plastocyanin